VGKTNDFQLLSHGLLANAAGRIVVPKSMQDEIMFMYHDHKLGGHLGQMKTLGNIQAKYFWPGMRGCIRRYVANCLTCAKRKAHPTGKAPLQPIPVTGYIFEKVAMDVVGPLPESSGGHTYILTCTEYTTKYAIACAMKDQTAKTVARKFTKHVIQKEGIPSVLLTDQGANFMSSTMRCLCQELGIKQIRTTAYKASTDGQAEALNKVLADMLTAFVKDNPSDWYEYLGFCVMRYNLSPNASTGEVPFYLIKGRDALEPTDLRPPMRYRFLEDFGNIFSVRWNEALALAKAHSVISKAKQKEQYDKNATERSFQVDDEILLKEMRPQTGKFYNRFDGPFVIEEKLSDVNYLIRRPEDEHTFVVHINRMYKWKGSEHKKRMEKDFNDSEEESDGESDGSDSEGSEEEECDQGGDDLERGPQPEPGRREVPVNQQQGRQAAPSNQEAINEPRYNLRRTLKKPWNLLKDYVLE